METIVCDNEEALGRRAAGDGAETIRRAVTRNGSAAIVVATGTSQFAMLSALIAAEGIDWSKVTGFHLDEYIGLDADHPASFRRYLRERFVDKVPLKAFHYIDGQADPQAECERLKALIGAVRIGAAFVGIGENGHLAFNDPPADFEAADPFMVVALAESARRQQVKEGWFGSLEDVPTHAISMTVPQIMSAERIICSVPQRRKAEAVRATVEGPVTPDVPASILQRHEAATLYLDRDSASLLSTT